MRRMPGTGETQGKCVTCRVRYIWRGRPRLSEARCLTCGWLLSRTTHMLKWRVREQQPTVAESREAALAQIAGGAQ